MRISEKKKDKIRVKILLLFDLILSLVFSHQMLTYLPEKIISNCENLREIDLSQNSLMMLQDNTLFNMTLTNLNLSHNQLRF